MSVLTHEPVLVTDSKKMLSEILLQIRGANTLPGAIEAVSQKIVELLDAERVTIFRRDRQSGEMVSHFKVADRLQEIRLASSTNSIAGFCALSRQVVNVEDAYDAQALTRIHPKLVFQGFFDRAYNFRTKAVLVSPILFNGALLGVLQIINRHKTGPFTDAETAMAKQLAMALGEKVRQELQSTSGPYARLVQAGRVSQGELDKLLERSATEKQPASRLLMRDFRIDAAAIGESLEQFYQIPYMPYDPAIVIPDALTQGIKKSYLRTCGWLPIAGDRNEMTVLIDDPSDSAKLREMQRILNVQTCHFRIGLPEEMLRYLEQDEVAPAGANATRDVHGPAEAETLVGDPAVLQLVDRMLIAARNERASHVHIEPAGGGLPTTVRFRVAGSCVHKESIPSMLHGAVAARIKDIASLDVRAQHLPQEGKLSVLLEGLALEYRVSIVPTVHGESMVLRPLTPDAKLLQIEELNLAPHHDRMLQKILAQPYGLMLVVGPAGSGKTTSLHAMLNRLNTPERAIWTVEDAVEIVQKGLQQVQANPKNGLAYADALRSVLLCDPDIILLGEMRDREVVEMGIDAARHGRLVFSSLHCSSAPEAVVRLMDWGVEKAGLADALLGVMSQVMVRKLCSHCKQAEPLSVELLDEMRSRYGPGFDEDWSTYLGQAGTLFRRGACQACQGTGYHGQMVIQELLVVSPQLKQLISHGARLEQIREAASDAGMRTLMQDRIAKVLQGHLDLGEVRGTN